MTNAISFTTKILATLTFIAATCTSIICSAACDFVEPGQCLGEGGLFGPCAPGNVCVDDLQCVVSDKGWICLPGAKAADDWAAAECASWRGDMACSKDIDRCFLGCDGPDDCKGGTVCDELGGMCVYPHDAESNTCLLPGEDFGPCVGSEGLCGDGLLCRSTLAGSICVPSCSNGCASRCAATLAAQCDDSGACVQPCDPTKTDCQDGQVCDSQTLTCTWAD
jgi:hypothetical protein